jgi:hypothetical protein
VTETYELDGRTSVTFKTGAKDKESLINFSGARQFVRAEMIAFFGLKPSECDGRSDYEVRVMCDQIAQAVALMQDQLGATLAPKEESKPASTQPRDQIPAAVHESMKDGDPWAQAEGNAEPAKTEPEPAPDPKVVMLDTIASQTNVKDLQRVWSENKVLFEDSEIMAAYKAKGKSLQAAA